MKEFDAIIIGSGQGGNPLAKKLAKAGWNTALIEKDKVGGTCINYGCTPTKTMIASARTAYVTAQSDRLGIHSGKTQTNIHTVLKRKAEVVERFRKSSEEGLISTENLELIYGTASFISAGEIKVSGNDGSEKWLSAKKIFINAGTRPAIPEIEGLEQAGYLTSRDLLELDVIPEHLVIIGGSYIALEFGQMYRRFGSKITILERKERVLTKEDEDISAEVARYLEEEDIEIVYNAEATHVKREGDKTILTFRTGEKQTSVEGSHLLIATGRRPNTGDLNLKAAGVETDKKGYIKVDEYLETSASGVYALGDIKGGPKFTHIAYHDHLILLNNVLHGEKQSAAGRIVPYCMFTDPQLGRVGITESDALKQGFRIKVASLPMSNVSRAIETGDIRGVMKAVVDADTGQILGAAILGAEGGEVMSVLQMAMYGGIPFDKIRDMMFAHPLYSESLNNLFMTIDK